MNISTWRYTTPKDTASVALSDGDVNVVPLNTASGTGTPGRQIMMRRDDNNNFILCGIGSFKLTAHINGYRVGRFRAYIRHAQSFRVVKSSTNGISFELENVVYSDATAASHPLAIFPGTLGMSRNVDGEVSSSVLTYVGFVSGISVFQICVEVQTANDPGYGPAYPGNGIEIPVVHAEVNIECE